MESMTIRSPRRALIARVGERLRGVVERPGPVALLVVAFLVVAFLAVTFSAGTFLAVDFLAVDFLAVAFLVLTLLAVVFLVLVFLAGVFFAGIVVSLTLTVQSAYFFALRGCPARGLVDDRCSSPPIRSTL